MSREIEHKAIILKKQPFGEADELITLFSEDAGKIRALAKSSKLPKSKLAHALHQASLVQVTFAKSSKLPKLIRVQMVNVFPHLREEAALVNAWFVASELILKATPDEQKNEQLFGLLGDFLKFLDGRPGEAELEIAIVKFKIHFLQAIGLGLWYPGGEDASPKFFSNSIGGFVNEKMSTDAVPIYGETWELFKRLHQSAWENEDSEIEPSAELNQLLSQFIEYQLEREIKSERFLRPSTGVV